MASKGMVYAVFRKHRSEKLFIEVFFIDLKRFYAFAFRWFFRRSLQGGVCNK